MSGEPVTSYTRWDAICVSTQLQRLPRAFEVDRAVFGDDPDPAACRVDVGVPAGVVGDGQDDGVEQRVGDLGARLSPGHALSFGGRLQGERAGAHERADDVVGDRLDALPALLRRQPGAPLDIAWLRFVAVRFAL